MGDAHWWTRDTIKLVLRCSSLLRMHDTDAAICELLCEAVAELVEENLKMQFPEHMLAFTKRHASIIKAVVQANKLVDQEQNGVQIASSSSEAFLVGVLSNRSSCDIVVTERFVMAVESIIQ